MTPEQERQIIDALIGAEETETLESRMAEGALIIQRLGFSSDGSDEGSFYVSKESFRGLVPMGFNQH